MAQPHCDPYLDRLQNGLPYRDRGSRMRGRSAGHRPRLVSICPKVEELAESRRDAKIVIDAPQHRQQLRDPAPSYHLVEVLIVVTADETDTRSHRFRAIHPARQLIALDSLQDRGEHGLSGR